MKNNGQISFKRNIVLLLVIAFIIINVTFCYSEVFAFSFTTSDSTGPMTVDFGSVSPKEPAVAIPHCAEILIVTTSGTWDLQVKANSDFTDTSVTPNKTFPISRLSWAFHPETTSAYTPAVTTITPDWTPFQITTNDIVLSNQPATSSEGVIIDLDYRLKVEWSDSPGNYQATLTYTVTAGNLNISYADPNPFSPDNDGTRDTTNIYYMLSEAYTINAWIEDTGGVNVHTLITSSDETLGWHNLPWDGNYNPDTQEAIEDGQYKYVIQNAVSEEYLAAGVVVVDTSAKSIVGGKITGDDPAVSLEGALVQLYDATRRDLYAYTTSDAIGDYTINGIPMGYYYVKASKENYYPRSTETFYVPAFTTTEDSTFTKNLLLSHNNTLFISKSANHKTASIGDIVTYTIEVKNVGTGKARNLTIEDNLPFGFKYMKGTAYFEEGQTFLEPVSENGRNLNWDISTLLLPGSKVTIKYKTVVGFEAKLGVNRNSANVYGFTSEGKVSAGPAAALVKVVKGIFRKEGTIIGKVFNDRNENGIQDEGEKGISGITLVMEDGTYVSVDEEGKYSIPSAKPGRHLLKILKETIPPGYIPVGGLSRVIDLPESGMAKADFGLKLKEGITLKGAEEVKEKKKVAGEKDQGSEQEQEETDILLIGVGEAEIGHFIIDGNVDNFVAGNEPYQSGFYTKAGLKFYLKGKIKGSYLLTMSFDSEQGINDEILNLIQENEYYPVYGDESTYSKTVKPYGMLYVALEYQGSYIEYGRHDTGFTQTEFTKYNRALPGIKTHYQNQKFNLTIFGAKTEQIPYYEEIPGANKSGPYYLSKAPLIEDSEHIRIITRDKDDLSVIIREEEKKINEDYMIDYVEGKVIFNEPIYKEDEDGNPIYISVNYEYIPLEGGESHYIVGARGELIPTDNLRVGLTYIEETFSLENYKLYGIDASIKIGKGATASLEYAESKGDAYGNNLKDNSQTNTAFKANLSINPNNKSQVELYYKKIDPEFNNIAHPLSETDIEEKGIKASVKVGEKIILSGEIKKVRDNIKNDLAKDINYKTTSQVNLEATPKENLKVELGYKEENSKTELLENDSETESNLPVCQEDETLATYYLKVKQKFNHDLEVGLGYSKERTYDNLNLPDEANEISDIYEISAKKTFDKVDIEVEYKFEDQDNLINPDLDLDIHGLSLKTNYKYADWLSFYAKEELSLTKDKDEQTLLEEGILPSLESSTAIGAKVERKINENWGVQGEYSLNFANNGTLTSDSLALGVAYNNQISDTLNMKANLKLGLNPNLINEEEGLADLSQIFYCQLDKKFSDTLQGKLKYEVTGKAINLNNLEHLAIAELTGKVTQDITTLLGYTFIYNEKEESHKLSTGIAYRPIENDRLNMLGKLEFGAKTDPNSVEEASLTFISALEAIYDLTDKIALTGKYAFKEVWDNTSPVMTKSNTNLFLTRLSYNFVDNWDIAGEYRIYYQNPDKEWKDNYRMELGYNINDYLRLALGYNFIEYTDPIYENNDYTGKGIYLNLGFSF
ncbi:DUF11 domain-containing protein [bacterium]|nr:DUF11 domain-containing protein [bacterium]MBU4602662.1 DUF11 domain-containing protein [bacterium]